MNRKEAMRLAHQQQTLQSLGFTADEAESLRRISMTLRRWFELECGTTAPVKLGQHGPIIWKDVHLERTGDDGEGKPVLYVGMQTPGGYRESRHPIPDRETGAKKRLEKILVERNSRAMGAHPKAMYPEARLVRETLAPHKCVSAYIQTDPRGAALYIIRPGDVPEGSTVESCYTRGICVY